MTWWRTFTYHLDRNARGHQFYQTLCLAVLAGVLVGLLIPIGACDMHWLTEPELRAWNVITE